LESEIFGVLDLIDFLMTTFGYTYKAYLSTRPEKSLGTDEEWEMATGALEGALKKRNLDYEVDEGGGVFYAPKIDIKLFDAIGREWQGPTVQVDLNLPKRFDVTYVDKEGNRSEAVMVHRAVLGSMERFCGGLIEHYAGAFPLWIAPTQVTVIPISDRHKEAAQKLVDELKSLDIRVHMDERSETMGYRIREAQVMQVPYMAVLGDKEIESGQVSVRHRREGDLGAMDIGKFVDRLKNEISGRKIDS